MNMKLSKKHIWILLAVFFLIRIVWCLIFGWKEIDPATDGPSYNSYALNILKGWRWLVEPNFLGHYRAPIYPIFLAVIYWLFGAENLKAVFFFQALINTITIYYIFKLSSRIFGEKNSYLAFIWSGLYVLYFYWIGRLYRESIIWFFLIFSFYHLWLFFEKRDVNPLKDRDMWLFLISFVLLVHTDARFLFYVPFFVLLFVLFHGLKKGLKEYFVMLVFFILLLVPWTIRNYIAYKGFVLINTRTLDMRKKNFFPRLERLKRKAEQVPANNSFDIISNPNFPSKKEIELIKKGLNPRHRPEYEVELIRKGKLPASTFIGRKLYYLARMWLPFKFSWDYYPFPDARLNKPWSLKHNIVSIVCYGLLWPFFITAVIILVKERNKAVWFLLFPIICHFILHFLMWGKERYRIQIDAFIIILGCYGIIRAYNFLKINFSNKIF